MEQIGTIAALEVNLPWQHAITYVSASFFGYHISLYEITMIILTFF